MCPWWSDSHQKPAIPFSYLPQEISKEFFVQVIKDPRFKKYIKYRDYYCFREQMLVYYDFKDHPILGRYKSGIIENSKEGLHFILSKKASTAAVDHYSRWHLAGNLGFQRFFARCAGLNSFHGIVKGRIVFFSLKGLHQGCSDWVSLHNFQAADYDSRGLILTAFNNCQFSLSYNQHINLRKHLGKVVKLNRILLDFMINEGYTDMKSLNCRSIICNPSYYSQLLNEKLELAETRSSYQRKKDECWLQSVTQLHGGDKREQYFFISELFALAEQNYRKRHLY